MAQFTGRGGSLSRVAAADDGAGVTRSSMARSNPLRVTARATVAAAVSPSSP